MSQHRLAHSHHAYRSEALAVCSLYYYKSLPDGITTVSKITMLAYNASCSARYFMNKRTRLRKQLQNVVSFSPLLAAMYILFYLESQNIWMPETPHRDKITLLVLILGMAASFVIRSFLWKKSEK